MKTATIHRWKHSKEGWRITARYRRKVARNETGQISIQDNRDTALDELKQELIRNGFTHATYVGTWNTQPKRGRLDSR